MTSELTILAATAASIGFVHTITGPDHYLPFIVIGRARGWRLRRTLLTAAVCGVGHVAGSVVLGLVGIGLGVAVGRLEIIEGIRGDLAAWLLISFGLIYSAWGVRQAVRNRPHSHKHLHADGTSHDHDHHHHHEHSHVHEAKKSSLTPWALFVIFVLGPCEPLIPILMYPAARANVGGLILVTAIFAVVTIATMVGMVYLAERGIAMLPLKKLERYAHLMAGLAIFSSGLAIRFLGL
jgi:nickel/cobalt transporter (NicO) family protein